MVMQRTRVTQRSAICYACYNSRPQAPPLLSHPGANAYFWPAADLRAVFELSTKSTRCLTVMQNEILNIYRKFAYPLGRTSPLPTEDHSEAAGWCRRNLFAL